MELIVTLATFAVISIAMIAAERRECAFPHNGSAHFTRNQDACAVCDHCAKQIHNSGDIRIVYVGKAPVLVCAECAKFSGRHDKA